MIVMIRRTTNLLLKCDDVDDDDDADKENGEFELHTHDKKGVWWWGMVERFIRVWKSSLVFLNERLKICPH